MARLDDKKLGVSGFDALNKALLALTPRKQANAIRNAVKASVKPVEAEAKATVPVGTRGHKTYKGVLVGPGFASRNIVRVAKTSRDRFSFSGIVGVKSQAFYVVQFWEYGSYGIERTPWLSNAFERKRVISFMHLRKELQEKIIKQALKK